MSDNKKKEIKSGVITGLQSTDINVFSGCISQLKKGGKTEDIQVLLDLLLDQKNKEINNLILKFLADVKDKSAVEIITAAISNAKYAAIKKNLLITCWESSLDFGEYLSIFVDCLIHSDFETAFEAFTVIENLTESISDKVKQKQQEKLKNAIAESNEDKKGILHEAIHILDQH
ncbi:hypothetical protein [Ancylomarina longa]|uniref:HEAT repeat domain-containing protein n=1 Tax=Ancylomarina longa TaxID=2487017 RepID=A0A434AZM5_9BACT|nr:hypothetical protein [Ancylomarina longa]RUT80071.1 hypothetical protein DLK05_01560 [Ancylomarina longa]